MVLICKILSFFFFNKLNSLHQRMLCAHLVEIALAALEKKIYKFRQCIRQSDVFSGE